MQTKSPEDWICFVKPCSSYKRRNKFLKCQMCCDNFPKSVVSQIKGQVQHKKNIGFLVVALCTFRKFLADLAVVNIDDGKAKL